MSGTFTIPEIRCNRHFYGATLCSYQAQAPINEGIVAIEPCAECLANAHDTLTADNARLRGALERIANDTSNCISQCKTSGDVSLLRVHSTVISVQILARAALAGKAGAR